MSETIQEKFSSHQNKVASRGFAGLIITQFLGAFNDNGFKIVISMFLVNKLNIGSGDTFYISLATALFVLPFILFSNWCGYLADLRSKRDIVIWAKFTEIAVMVFGLIAFYLENIHLIFFSLFLMGSQSTLFSPAKYGILPEILKDEELSKGNGIIELTTFMAIIFGTVCGSLILFPYCKEQIWLSSIFFIGVAVIGTLTSFMVPKIPAVGPSSPFRLNFLSESILELKRCWKVEGLLLTVIAIACFWALGTAVQNNIYLYPKEIMHSANPEQTIGVLFTILAIGIGLGAGLAGWISGPRIELRLIPFGAIGMAIFLFDLNFSHHSMLRTSIDLFMMGVSGGIFTVPLNANLQKKAPDGETGRMVGLNNFISNIFMVLASFVYFFMSAKLQFSPATVFLALAGFSLVLAIIVFITFVWRSKKGFYTQTKQDTKPVILPKEKES